MMKTLCQPTRSVRFGLLLGASLAVSAAAAENWPQWRGPAGNGLVAQGNPPLEWSEQKNVKWKVAIPGQGHATPIIWGDKIFVLTAIPLGSANGDSVAVTPGVAPEAPPQRQDRGAAGGPPGDGNRPRPPEGGRGGRGGFGGGPPPTQEYAFAVLCFDRATGEQLWQKDARRAVPHQGIQRSNSYASGSPVTDGEHLYAFFGSQGLYCYDLAGNEVWHQDLGQHSVTFGEGSSPALAGDVLVVVQDTNDDSFLFGFDKRTGKELWRTPRDEGSGWTTPFVLTQGGKTQIIVNGANAVVAYDPKTGKSLWQCSGLGSNPVPMIVADQDMAYAMSGHRNGAGLAIKLGQSGDLTGTDALRWKTDRGTPYVPSPLLYDGLLFFCQRNDALFTCLDAATGEVHFEQQRLDEVKGIYASPIGVNDRIYWPGQNGVTLVLDKAKELKVLASNQLEDGFDASPAVIGDELYLRGRQNLYCIAAE